MAAITLIMIYNKYNINTKYNTKYNVKHNIMMNISALYGAICWVYKRTRSRRVCNDDYFSMLSTY
jgi:hypothetical protein